MKSLSLLHVAGRTVGVFSVLVIVSANHVQNVSEYDKEIPQPHYADQTTVPCRRDTEQNSIQKGRLLDQEMILFNCVPFQNRN